MRSIRDRPLFSAGRTLSFAVRSPRRLVSICRNPPLQRMTRGRPARIQLRASRPARAQCVLPPLVGFRSPSALFTAPDLAARLPAVRSVLGVPRELAVAIGRGRRASPRDDQPRSIIRGSACSTSTATSTRSALRPRTRIASSRALATNAVPFAQASPSNNFVLPESESAQPNDPASRLSRVSSPPGATDTRPSPPACFALASSRPPLARSTHRARDEARGHKSAPRSVHAPTGRPRGLPS
jgi:hypothetical protein